MHITDELFVAAPLETVWRLTEDIEHWPATTRTMQSVELIDSGPLRVGSTAKVKQPGQRAKVWTVTELVPNHCFAWRSTVFGVAMTARHDLAEAAGGCRNTLSVDLSGRGSRLVGRLIGRQIRSAIVTENLGFKRHAEASVV